MPFEKGNKLWKEGHKARKENQLRLNELMGIVVSNGFTEYVEKLHKLSDKEKLEKPELDFMDRLEKLLEYAVPKLARTEVTGKNGKDLEVKLVKYDDNNNTV